jgi:hypothetical protein
MAIKVSQTGTDWLAPGVMTGGVRARYVPGTGGAQRWFFSGIWLAYLIAPVSDLFGHRHSPAWTAGGAGHRPGRRGARYRDAGPGRPYRRRRAEKAPAPNEDRHPDHLRPEGTVRNYLSACIQKTGARNRAEALKIASERGWL